MRRSTKALCIAAVLLAAIVARAETYQLTARAYDARGAVTVCRYRSTSGKSKVTQYVGQFPCPPTIA